ncbi:CBM96 family carbohydrate-binding protein [Flavivirga rizhaonensis]|uniref:DNRLRE domain-containing protein n=1 Tax=Flavivirga rizhaonensis TaxID=2559571 RepID=A0A4S1E2A8_9FLAO|nr:DNRLRE domain-containing protein [Flavivirga rizhaonensis]TGV04766.1 DNRLRE domain-containing protein [Flavivirga rizhaonensis]
MKLKWLLFTSLFCVSTFTEAQDNFKILVSEDTYVQGGDTSTDTMGETYKKQLRISNSNAKSKYARITYLKFLLPKKLRSIGHVVLHIPVKVFNKTDDLEKTFKLDVYTVQSDDWSESTLTWDTKPEVDKKVGSINLKKTEGKQSEWQAIVLNTYEIFKMHSRKDSTITLALLNTDFNKTSAICPSKEQSKKSAAYLVIK